MSTESFTKINLSDKRIALFGGSFNPVHNGHVQTAEYLQSLYHFDWIFFIPVNIPVHKDSSEIISGEHRLQMTKLAVTHIDNAVVSDMEIVRGGNSYTVDTVRHLLKWGNQSTDIAVIIGDDLLNGLHQWKEIDTLNTLAHFICLTRDGVRLQLPYNIEYINNPIIHISSSEIRLRIRKGQPIDNLVPESVKEYINSYHLYR